MHPPRRRAHVLLFFHSHLQTWTSLQRHICGILATYVSVKVMLIQPKKGTAKQWMTSCLHYSKYKLLFSCSTDLIKRMRLSLFTQTRCSYWCCMTQYSVSLLSPFKSSPSSYLSFWVQMSCGWHHHNVATKVCVWYSLLIAIVKTKKGNLSLETEKCLFRRQMCHHALLDNKTNVAVTRIDRPLKWKFIALNGTVGISKYDVSPQCSCAGATPTVASVAGFSRVLNRVHLLEKTFSEGHVRPPWHSWLSRQTGRWADTSLRQGPRGKYPQLA